ncbi:MAG: hypothetical protein KF782_13180 [Labilithrix sp.]|nr:hypothetical protein [Labilithrix sp.]
MSSTRRLGILALFTLGAAVSSCGSDDAAAPAETPPPADGAPAPGDGEAPPPAADGGAPDADGAAPPAPATPSCQGKEKLTGDLDWTIAQRTVHVHVPASYDPSKGTAIVLDFHGYTSNGDQQATYAGMNTKSDTAGFVAVHPEGTGFAQSWNGGVCCGTASSTGVDDVAFVSAILDELATKLCVDPKRVFATGLSNGGFLSHRLACELSGRVAAIAPVAGVIGVSTCAPARPVPVMQFHGTSDTLVPYNGNPLSGYPSVPSTIAKWAERNGCTGAATESFKSGDVQCMTHAQCAAGAEVTLCTVTGGGHTWPGSSTSLPIPGLGKTTQAINATDAMWAFFQKHPLP